MEKKIFRYLDNDLPPDEKRLFEEAMERYPSLKAEVQETSYILGKTLTLKEQKPSEDYFNESLVRFRNTMESRKPAFFGKLIPATGFASVIILSLFYVMSFLQLPQSSDLDLVSYFENELNYTNYYTNYYTNDYSYFASDTTSTVIESELLSQIVASDSDLDDLADSYDIEYSELLASLSDEEVSQLLSQMNLEL